MNWAKLDKEGLEGIAEYLEYAKQVFPEDKLVLNEKETRELLKVYTHLMVCIKVMLLNYDDEYRNKEEHSLVSKALKIKDEGDLY